MYLETKSTPTIVLDDECLNTKDLSCSLMGRVKEFTSLSNLKKVLCNEGFDVLKISYLASEDFTLRGRIAWVEVEGIPFKLWSGHTFNHIGLKWGKLMEVDDYDDTNFHSKRLCILTKEINNVSDVEEVPETCFNVPEGQKGNLKFRGAFRWELSKKVNEEVAGDDNSFVHTVGGKENYGLVNKMSDSMGSCRLKKSGMPRTGGSILSFMEEVVKDQWDDEIVMMGDFNEVRYKSERFGSNFKAHDTDIFNSFIHNAGLNEVHLGGIAFTWVP
nr:nucleotide-binding alpha-beta plait domain-containing protein [Tanacetum cinerariifolium]